MVALKDTYPLYLNNKAVQPNTDLAVTDKFTGEVAFRTALAAPEVIDEAIAGAQRVLWEATRIVAEGMTSLTQFSTGPAVSKTRISCVPVPTSRARMRIAGYCTAGRQDGRRLGRSRDAALTLTLSRRERRLRSRL